MDGSVPSPPILYIYIRFAAVFSLLWRLEGGRVALSRFMLSKILQPHITAM